MVSSCYATYHVISSHVHSIVTYIHEFRTEKWRQVLISEKREENWNWICKRLSTGLHNTLLSIKLYLIKAFDIASIRIVEVSSSSNYLQLITFQIKQMFATVSDEGREYIFPTCTPCRRSWKLLTNNVGQKLVSVSIISPRSLTYATSLCGSQLRFHRETVNENF